MRTRGYTMLELIIAVSLSVVVLMAIFSVMTSMFRFQIEGFKKSTVTGWSLASLMKMTKEIESASVLAYPLDATPRDYLVGCVNWSRIISSGQADSNQNVVVFYYCYDSANKTIRRLAEEPAAAGCPGTATVAPALPACNAIWGGANRQNDVIATNVNRHSSGAFVFTRDDGIGGVRIRFVVGEKTYVHVDGKPDVVNPQYMEFDTGVSLSRSYLNSND
ncbi:MAG: hypothetical protein A2506_03870 [Elusimicrobia bacterium RIFOXYD12_FULL_66_9]|nr:MAG: hypothetical protein A2506_03870 [Elusimicrobia bacterium RIFOXYD12_FULL_66_9]